jgi:hypothetical protein
MESDDAHDGVAARSGPSAGAALEVALDQSEDSAQSLTPEEMLLERFRLHKQHAREKEVFLRKTRRDAATRGGSSSRKKPVAASPARATKVELSRVDHNNRPHRWKDAPVLIKEMEQRAFQSMLKHPEPVRPFPGRLRSRIYNADDKSDPSDAGENATAVPSALMQEAEEASTALSPVGNVPQRLGMGIRGGTANDDELLKIDQSQFPLHLFDSDELESHTPSEWLRLCPHPTTSRASGAGGRARC